MSCGFRLFSWLLRRKQAHAKREGGFLTRLPFSVVQKPALRRRAAVLLLEEVVEL